MEAILLSKGIEKTRSTARESMISRTLIRGGYDLEELRRLVIISFAASRFDSN